MKKLVVFRLFHKIVEIYTGWKNYIFRKVEIEILYNKRIAICNKCDFYSKYKICTKCTCPGAGKARSPKSICPIGAWEINNKFDAPISNDQPHVPMMQFNSSDDYIRYINTFNN